MAEKVLTKGIISIMVLFFISALTCRAQDSRVIQKQEVFKIIDTTRLIVDVFIPQQESSDQRNAMVFFHGGGWVFGHTGEFHGACRRYAKKGFVTFSFEYRLSANQDGTFPNPAITPVECVKDARSAVRWVRENAERFNINPDKIIVGGQSVGGQLTLMTELGDGIDEDTDDLSISPKPNLMLLYSSTVNTLEAWCDRILQDKRKMIWDISPHHNIREGMPPAIEFHGLDDHTVKFWIVRLFEQKTKKHNNTFETVTYEGRAHYLGEGNVEYSRLFDEEILERTDEFIIRHGFMK